MSSSESSRLKPVTLDDLIALNEEIASLVRAGIPLELGLQGLSSSVSRRLGALTERLTDQMQKGATLSEAVAANADRLPRIYRAVVEAGVKAGRLPQALESLSAFTRTVQDLRQCIGLAMLYPTIVIVIAYGLFVAFMYLMVPRLLETFRLLDLPIRGWLSGLQWLHSTVAYWGPVIPLAVVALMLFLLLSSRFSLTPMLTDTTGLGRGGWTTAVARLPLMKPILRNFHRANFAELLAVLLEHEVPLHDALRLAGDATGDTGTVRMADEVARDVQAGSTLAGSLKTQPRLPPFMKWMMATGEQQGALPGALWQVSGIYGRRARSQAEIYKLVMPLLITVLVGGGAVLAYALTLFLPLTQMMRRLS